jgi:hypothetical protein
MKHQTVAARLARTRLVTRHYHQLQGLRQIPVGLLFLTLAVDRAGWWPLFSVWQPISGILVFGLAIVGIWLAGRYYDQRIGRVTHRSSMISKVAFVAWLALFLAAQWVEALWQWPVSASMLVFALMYGVGYWVTGRALHQYLAAACLLVIISLLPLTGLLTNSQLYLFGPESAPGVALVGLIMILVGLVDHWWLIRSLQSLREGAR